MLPITIFVELYEHAKLNAFHEAHSHLTDFFLIIIVVIILFKSIFLKLFLSKRKCYISKQILWTTPKK